MFNPLIFIIVILIAIILFLLYRNSKLKQLLSEFNQKFNDINNQMPVLREKVNMYENYLTEIKSNVDNINKEKQQLIAEKSALIEKTQHYEQQLQQLNQEKNNLFNENKQLKDENSRLNADNSALMQKVNFFQSQLNELKDLHSKLKIEFENITSKILEQNATKLAKHNEETISNAIKPFKESMTQIKELEQKIQNYYDNENKERTVLKTNIENLIQQSNEVKQTAEKLANALTTQVKYQGNWGEMILERLLEMSGLEKNIEYVIQQKYEDKQPDVIILLPDNRYLIIDSKVTLNAFIEYQQASNNDEKNIAAQKIITSVKQHYIGLSEKEYTNININNKSSTLDFVLMFIPIESIYHIILQYNPEIFNDAIKNRVLIVTPTSLLATLKTIYFVWKQEKQKKEFDNIINSINNLYNKIKTFTVNFGKVEDALKKALESYEDAKKTLISGKGNAMSIIEKNIKPYINPKESIDKKFLPEEDNDEKNLPANEN